MPKKIEALDQSGVVADQVVDLDGGPSASLQWVISRVGPDQTLVPER